jgi:hypothetical protein
MMMHTNLACSAFVLCNTTSCGAENTLTFRAAIRTELIFGQLEKLGYNALIALAFILQMVSETVIRQQFAVEKQLLATASMQPTVTTCGQAASSA